VVPPSKDSFTRRLTVPGRITFGTNPPAESGAGRLSVRTPAEFWLGLVAVWVLPVLGAPPPTFGKNSFGSVKTVTPSFEDGLEGEVIVIGEVEKP
jgi:hypothetical protein